MEIMDFFGKNRDVKQDIKAVFASWLDLLLQEF